MPKKRFSQSDSVEIQLNQSSKIKTKKKNFRFTPKQVQLLGMLLDPENKIIFISGAAGTSKTYMALYGAVEMMSEDSEKQLIYIRSIIESADKGLGSLPGPQPLYSKILTPNGWVTMGDIKVGDEVFTPEGSAVNVVGVYDKGIKDVYEIETIDGRKAHACLDHFWEIIETNKAGRYSEPKIVSTQYIQENLKNKNNDFKIILPQNECIQFPHANLPIEPYVLGVLLGDGHMGHSVSFSNIDEDIIQKTSSLLEKDGFVVSRVSNSISYNISYPKYNNKPAKKVLITNGNSERAYSSVGIACIQEGVDRNKMNRWCREEKTIHGNSYKFLPNEERFSNPIKKLLFDLKLLKTTHENKFIPDIYKFSSREQRLELLRGILDTDGNIKENGETSLTTTSKLLAFDVKELVCSLGGRAYVTHRDRSQENTDKKIQSRKVCYRVNISLGENPFFCKRKRDKYVSPKFIRQIKIKSVTKVGSEPVKCIKINSQRELYITDDYIVTHNTLQEKFDPFLMPLYDKFEEIVLPQDVAHLKSTGRISAVPINFLRGASWTNKIIVADEAQNFSAKELITLITRIGEGSKIIICGDAMQSDIGKLKSGFMPMLNTFNDEESKQKGIQTFVFTKEDIVRSEILKFIVKKLEDGDFHV